MIGRATELLASFVTSHRHGLLVVTAVVAVGAAILAQSVVMDPSPKSLVTTWGDQAEAAAVLGQHFGNTDYTVVVLVEAEDALAPPVLEAVRSLSRRFRAEPFVTRVESITSTPLPTRRLEAPAPTLDELEDVDPLEDGDPTQALTADRLAALEALLAAEPDRFPGGLSELSERASAVQVVDLDSALTIGHDDSAALRQVLEDAPLVDRRLIGRITPDGKRHVAAIAVFLSHDDVDHDATAHAVETIDTIVATEPLPAGVEVRVGGLPHLWVEIVDRMHGDQTILVPLTLVVCMLFLFASLRWVPGTVLPIVAVGISAVLLVGGMAAAGEPLNILNNIIPPLLITIGVSDSIHLIGRYREELRGGAPPLEAMRTTVRTMATACLLTSVTTAVGLASLLVSQTTMLQRFGAIAALGVLAAYLVTIVFLPAALLSCPPPKRRDRSRGGGLLETTVSVITTHVLRRPWTVVLGAVALTGMGAAAATLVEVDTALLDQFAEGDPVYDTTVLMERELVGVRPLEILLVGDGTDDLRSVEVINALDRTAEFAAEQEGVLHAASAADLLHEVWFLLSGDPAVREAPIVSQAQLEALAILASSSTGEASEQTDRGPDPLASYLSVDGDIARLEVRVADVGAQRTMQIINDIHARLERELRTHGAPDVRVVMTGDAFTGSVPITAVTNDMISSLGLAVVLIFGMLTVLFRSVRLGLLSIPSNGLPLLGAVAWMAIRGIPLNVATAIIFSISIGLAVDGTIHVLARFQEERAAGHGIDDALLRAARGTGRAIVISSLVLMFGFSVLLFSGFVPVRYFGELIAVTAAGCLASTLVLQPALLKLGASKDPFPRAPRS